MASLMQKHISSPKYLWESHKKKFLEAVVILTSSMCRRVFDGDDKLKWYF